MFKDILVPMMGRRGDMDALNVGAFLAENEGARLTVLQMIYLPTAFSANWALSRETAGGDVYRALRAEGESQVIRLKARLGTETFQTDVKPVESSVYGAWETIARHAYHADLTVVAGAIGDKPDAGSMHAFLANLFMASGGPVLVVPPRCKVAVPPRRIVVAWRPVREAARALHDAMPLLMKAHQVDVVMVDSGGLEQAGQDPATAEVVAHLAQHGVDANFLIRDPGSRPVSSVLLDHVRDVKAELLVAGGYGHSRFRESVLGGVTRELLISSPIPVLYSH